jgi:hypothetical protein
MKTPSFEHLSNEIRNHGFHTQFYGSFMHPNPRIFKYYWWIFWEGSICDGNSFLVDENRLSTNGANALCEKLSAQKISHWIYNTRLPRLDTESPFDPSSKKWQGVNWAPAFDEDCDRLTSNGFK